MDYRHSQFVEGYSEVSAARHGPVRTSALPFIIAAGLAGAITSWFVPVALYELIVESVGLSELFGAFAAPLGLTARLLIALAAALVSVILVAALFMKNSSVERVGTHFAHRKPTDSQGATKMASQAPDAGDYRNEAKKPASNGGWFRRIMSSLPAPRRFDEPAEKSSPEPVSEQKRLRPGAAVAREQDERPRPIAAHSELGDPLPPIEPVQASPAPIREFASIDAEPASRADDSIEALTDRLARVLGRGSDFVPQPETQSEPLSEPDPSKDECRRSEAERTELESARQAARLAVDEAEEAKARAERNVEEASEQARRTVEEAEAAVLRADERASDARHRLAALEEQLSALPKAQAAAAPSPVTPVATAQPSEFTEPEGAEMDPALRDALRTLRRMTAQQ